MQELGRFNLLLDLISANPKRSRHLWKLSNSWSDFKNRLISDESVGSFPTGYSEWVSTFQDSIDINALTWEGSLTFSIIVPIYKVLPQWLIEAIESVQRQIYPHWELICVDDGSRDGALSKILREAGIRDHRIRHIELTKNVGVSRATNQGLAKADGDYVILMDHDDILQPQALARFADAASKENSDLLYGDELVVGENVNEILGIQARPAFSADYYLSHPYFVHPVAVRSAIAKRIGGLDERLSISQDVDFILRVIEHSSVITHVPDILYRWRTSRSSVGHQRKEQVMAVTAKIKTDHLRRIGFPHAEVRPGPSFNTFITRYHYRPIGRILAIIPTRNQHSLLEQCVRSVRHTTASLDLDLMIVNHDSTQPEILDYFADLTRAGEAQIMNYSGIFNYSKINNTAVREAGRSMISIFF